MNYAADYPSANNTAIAGIYLQDDTIGSLIENTVIWGCSKGIYINDADSDVDVDHCTVGAAARETGGTWQYAFGDRANSGRFNVTNSVAVANDFLVGLYQASSASDYNNLHGNSSDASVGAHDTYVDPEIAYIPRVEVDSPNYDGGSTGHRGATILHRYGVDGTFYGESGFDVLTTESLWPWPNQDVIKTAFRNDYGATDETRGFCAADQTLTQYIWEYAGNEMPDDIPAGGAGGGGGEAPNDGGAGGGGTAPLGDGGDPDGGGCSGCSCVGTPSAGAWSLISLFLLRLRRRRHHR